MTSYVLWMMSGDGLAFEIRSGVGVKLHCIIIMVYSVHRGSLWGHALWEILDLLRWDIVRPEFYEF